MSGFVLLYIILLPVNMVNLFWGLEANNDFAVMCGLIGTIFCIFGLSMNARRW